MIFQDTCNKSDVMWKHLNHKCFWGLLIWGSATVQLDICVIFFPFKFIDPLNSIQKMTKFYPRNHEILWKWGHRSFTRPPFPRNQSPNILELHNRHTMWHWRARIGDKFSWIWIQFAWIQIPIQPTLWSRANYLKTQCINSHICKMR